MLPAEPPTPTPEDDQPEPEFRPRDEPVPAMEPSAPEGSPRCGEKTGATDDSEYEPL